jgi:ATP-binding cassette subfamily B protein
MKLFPLSARVLAQLGRERGLGLLLTFANVLLAVAAFAQPILFGRIVDSLYGGAGNALAAGPVMRLVGAWAAFGLFHIGAGVFVALHADRLAHRRRLAVIEGYFEHALNLPASFHSETHSGRVLKVMLEGAQAMFHLWLSFFRTHCASIVTIFVLLPMTLLLNARMGLLLVGLVGLFGGLTWFVVRKTGRLQHEVEQFHSDMAERAADALSNLRVVQSFTRVDAEVAALKTTAAKVLAAQIPVLSWWAVVSVSTRAASTLTVLGVLFTGAYLRLHGEATVGDIVTFTTFATLLIRGLDEVVHFVSALFALAPKITQFFELTDAVPAITDAAEARDPGRVRGAVRFEDVTFAYGGDRPAVRGLSFDVAPGEVVALVGTTGSGKSTTASLLYRAFEPQAGSISIDGIDLREMSLDSLRRNVGVVFQEPMLFARSIRENVLVGRPDATDADVLAAITRAQALDIAMRPPCGLDAMVGEAGRGLSGGERQRLAIARALLKDPPVLILDEATSALDASTESRLQLALDEVMKGRTTFVIAHRLATIRNATRVIVLDHGQVVETGTFDELVARGGPFATLARAQLITGQPETTFSETLGSPVPLPLPTSAAPT